MQHDAEYSNPSDNTTFGEVLTARLSRRTIMAGGLATAALAFFGDSVASASKGGKPGKPTPGGAPIGFGSIIPNSSAVPTIAAEYQFDTLIPWGQLIDGSPDDFDRDLLTAAEQARRIGIGHDGMWYFGNDQRGLLCINHEFGDTSTVLGKPAPQSFEDVQTMLHAHGMSVLTISRVPSGRWQLESSPKNRRIHGNTPVEFSGPAAGSALLQTPAKNPTLGTLNNCAHGYTPWGTYLTCEENFNGYFGAKTPASWVRTPMQERYGFSSNGFGYGWHTYDERFDLSNAQFMNEENRFGWVVEVDPNRPDLAPVKRTALGRLKHEGATFVEGKDGHAVVYTGDDERFEYIYKYVSSGPWRAMRGKGSHPLDDGKLYVAKFNAGGTGEWLELTVDNPAIAAVLPTQEQVLVYARRAADLAGATKMDRPEWITVAPDGQVYCTLTNNSNRGAVGRPAPDAANPIAINRFGHIIRWTDTDQRVGLTFTWDIYVLAKAVTENGQQMFGSPDGLWADPDGRIFIQTDGTQPNDPVTKAAMNDQMLVGDPVTKEIRRLFTGVKGCEVTGITVTPDRRTMFVNLQHPGDGDPTVTNFPMLNATPDGTTIPRDATVVITRKDGGIIGS